MKKERKRIEERKIVYLEPKSYWNTIGFLVGLGGELQMLLTNRTQRSSSDFISLSDREDAFKSLGLKLEFT